MEFDLFKLEELDTVIVAKIEAATKMKIEEVLENLDGILNRHLAIEPNLKMIMFKVGINDEIHYIQMYFVEGAWLFMDFDTEFSVNDSLDLANYSDNKEQLAKELIEGSTTHKTVLMSPKLIESKLIKYKII